MTEKIKTGTTMKKVAPRIVVSSPASRNSIDELHKENEGKEFAYSSPSSGSGKSGGIPVKDADGQVLKVGNRIIVEVNKGSADKERAEQARFASERISEVNDPDAPNSKPKSAKAKKPIR